MQILKKQPDTDEPYGLHHTYKKKFSTSHIHSDPLIISWRLPVQQQKTDCQTALHQSRNSVNEAEPLGRLSWSCGVLGRWAAQCAQAACLAFVFPIFKLGGSRVDFLVSLHSTDSGGLLPPREAIRKKIRKSKEKHNPKIIKKNWKKPKKDIGK